LMTEFLWVRGGRGKRKGGFDRGRVLSACRGEFDDFRQHSFQACVGKSTGRKKKGRGEEKVQGGGGGR